MSATEAAPYGSQKCEREREREDVEPPLKFGARRRPVAFGRDNFIHSLSYSNEFEFMFTYQSRKKITVPLALIFHEHKTKFRRNFDYKS